MQEDELLETARSVNWYSDPHLLLANTDLLLAQVMARGTVKDVGLIMRTFSVDQMRHAYEIAPPGLFDRRSWAYWGLVLLGDPDARPLPERFSEAADLDWRAV